MMLPGRVTKASTASARQQDTSQRRCLSRSSMAPSAGPDPALWKWSHPPARPEASPSALAARCGAATMTLPPGLPPDRGADQAGQLTRTLVPVEVRRPRPARGRDRRAAGRVGQFLDGPFRYVLDPLPIVHQPAPVAVADGVPQAIHIVADPPHADARRLQNAQPPAFALRWAPVLDGPSYGGPLPLVGQLA